MRHFIFFLLPFTACQNLETSSPAPMKARRAGLYHRESIAHISYGKGPGQLAFRASRGEQLNLGPAAIALDGAGGFIILDALNGRVLRFDGRGKHLSTQPADRHGVDLKAGPEGRLYFLNPLLSRISVRNHQGRLLSVLPLDRRLRYARSLLFEEDGLRILTAQQSTYRLERGGKVLSWLDLIRSRLRGIACGARRFNTTLSPQGPGKVTLHHRLNGETVKLRTITMARKEKLGAIRPLACDRSGNMYVILEILGAAGIQRIINRITPAGIISAEVRLPAHGESVPYRDLAIAGDGTIWHLQPKKTAAEVTRWRWRP